MGIRELLAAWRLKCGWRFLLVGAGGNTLTAVSVSTRNIRVEDRMCEEQACFMLVNCNRLFVW